MTDVVPGTEVAGGSAQLEYRRGLKMWRRRFRLIWWSLFTVSISLFVFAERVGSHNWAVALGFVAGSLFGVGLAFRDQPPAHI